MGQADIIVQCSRQGKARSKKLQNLIISSGIARRSGSVWNFSIAGKLANWGNGKAALALGGIGELGREGS